MPTITTEQIYSRRFAQEERFRVEMWRALCSDYFQAFVPESSTVVELAAGYCEFINNIRARRRIAVDINPETARRADADVEVVLTSATDLSSIEDGTIDVVFVSNFFEHITREDIAATVSAVRRCLRPGGVFLILQPNIRYAARDYWMFFDHITPIDDRALCELLELSGFAIQLNRPRFLPYTTRGRLPKSVVLLRAYLRLPFLHRWFGGQAFVVAQRVD